ncbi:MAG TPA: hypothetical protein VLA66_03945, partial [Thermoanaerobaculia bacterium]|nr:hypothetical protein [Thermoanaerobaculia bacterium]
ERSAALSPPGGFAHTCSLAVLLDDLGGWAESGERLLACAPGQADFAEARYRLCLHLLEAGDVEGARGALAEAIAADPGIEARARADGRLSALY